MANFIRFFFYFMKTAIGHVMIVLLVVFFVFVPTWITDLERIMFSKARKRKTRINKQFFLIKWIINRFGRCDVIVVYKSERMSCRYHWLKMDDSPKELVRSYSFITVRCIVINVLFNERPTTFRHRAPRERLWWAALRQGACSGTASNGICRYSIIHWIQLNDFTANGQN